MTIGKQNRNESVIESDQNSDELLPPQCLLVVAVVVAAAERRLQESDCYVIVVIVFLLFVSYEKAYLHIVSTITCSIVPQRMPPVKI